MQLVRRAATPIALAIALAAPAGASAGVQANAATVLGEPYIFVLDSSEAQNRMAVTTVEVVEGFPDIVIGDTSAGIVDPIPPDCARVDPTIIRCPASNYVGLMGDLGPGDDFLSVARDFGYRSAGFPAAGTAAGPAGLVRMQFGPGADAASDLSPYRDVWKGGSGRDRFNSGPGNDKVNGGSQNDIIDCGAGKHDVGIGGPGKRDLGRRCEVVKH
jgi:Ca2+-binding RTX toxin-like protein